MNEHGKLVRDNTENVARSAGVSGRWYKATPEEAINALGTKLVEEALEYLLSRDLLELWDLRDVLVELMERLGAMERNVVAYHLAKVSKFGMFKDNVMWNPIPERHEG